jgi:macrodomain Ter protein organizer (MatP/YcbG family)
MAIITDRPSGGTQRRNHWDSDKRTRNFSVSDACWAALDGLANKAGMNRSEVIEVVVRYAESKELDLPEERVYLLNRI